MSQKNGAVNFLIHDASGQPQVIKVVQGTPTKPTGSQLQVNSGSVKTMFKVPGTPDNSQQGTPVYKTVKVTGIKSGSKIVQVPIQTFNHLQKSIAESQRSPSGYVKKFKTQSAPNVKLVSSLASSSGSSRPVASSSQSHGNIPMQSSKSPTRSHSSGSVQSHSSQSFSGSPQSFGKSSQSLGSLSQYSGVSQSSSNSSMQSYSNSPLQLHGKKHTPPLMHLPMKREPDDPVPEYTSKRRKAADKVGKGLRHFSLKVCDKVRAKGFTSYNEVADELVAEFAAGIHGSPDTQNYDQKNIRRRVYDALNVLMAMNIISKEKKEIRWIGLPTNSAQEYASLERDKDLKTERIQQKTQQLHDLLLQQISFKSLVERNRAAESRGVKPSAQSAIHLPFIVLNTSDKSLIDCSISSDKSEYMFNFDKKFQIYDDIDILKRMGLLLGVDKGECTAENLKIAQSMVPRSLAHYVQRIACGEPIRLSDMVKTSLSDNEEELETDETAEWDNLEELEEGGVDSSSEDTSSDVDIN